MIPGSASDFITLVSGLPRSGTSMMMRMIAAGGMPVLTDDRRRPDLDNPHGYFENEAVKEIARDPGILDAARGKAVKVISMLLPDLPLNHRYRVVFMTRDINEVLASQAAMLERQQQGSPQRDQPDDALLAEYYQLHLRQVRAWLEQRPQFAVMAIDHADVMARPLEIAAEVASFLELPGSVAAMAETVDSTLHRQRAATA